MLQKLCAALLAMAIAVPTASARPRKKTYEENGDDGRTSLRKASTVLKPIPRSLTLRVGQRVSMEGVNVAGTFSKQVLRLEVSGGVLTILAVGPGSATVELHGTRRPAPNEEHEAPPSKISVKVER